jgi:hypothetical protein
MMMNVNHNIKNIVYIILLSVFAYFGFFLFITIRYQHHINYSSFDRYLWILGDSIKKDVDSVYFVGLERESDNLYEYIIHSPRGKHFITICHLKNIDTIDLKTIKFIQGISIDNLKIYPAEKFNLKSEIRPEITIKSLLPLNNSLIVNLNHHSEINKNFDSVSYIGFYGVVNKMTIRNNNGKDLFLFDYGSRMQPTLFLIYKGHRGIFFILINSEIPIDESIVNILSSRIRV